MRKKNLTETLINGANVLILVTIVLLYVITGTGVGDDAVAALSDRTVYRGSKADAVALECVVSWNAAALTSMLDTLEEHGARITFFVSGQWAKENAALLKRMQQAGHEIGSAGHVPGLDGDEALMRQDVETSIAVIRSITGDGVSGYHAGLRDKSTASRVAGELGIRHVSCTADLLSARGDAVDIASRASQNLFDGSILMMQPTAQAAEALPAILESIREAGLTLLPVGEILK